MKKIIFLLISAFVLLSLSCTVLATTQVMDVTKIDVTTWQEFNNAFKTVCQNSPDTHYLIRLKNDLHMDLATATKEEQDLLSVELCGFVTFDFNGYTLSCSDNSPKVNSNLSNRRRDFISITMVPIDYGIGSELTITDSAGDGGIFMDAYRDEDSQIAALVVMESAVNRYKVPYTLHTEPLCKLTINGGNFTLCSRVVQMIEGTFSELNNYRGTVIADGLGNVEINGGRFEAFDRGNDYDVLGSGYTFYGNNSRELTAFGTSCTTSVQLTGINPTNLVINGGLFISPGYSIHHFYGSYSELYMRGDVAEKLTFPVINGGVFEGAIGYIGRSGVECEFGDPIAELEARKLSTIISEDSFVDIAIDDGWHSSTLQPDDVTLGEANCENFKMIVVSDSLLGFKTYPTTDGKTTTLARDFTMEETFRVSYRIPHYLSDKIEVTPYIRCGDSPAVMDSEWNCRYEDYEGQSFKVVCGIWVEVDDGSDMGFYNNYEITVTEPQSAVIVTQPISCKVEPGETASLTVKADYAASYQWYTYLNSYRIPIAEPYLTNLFEGIDISGYDTDTLNLCLDEPCKWQFYCVVTGTDGTTTTSKSAYMTFGGIPKVLVFNGGEYEENGDAVFTLWADYAEMVKWVVETRSGVAKYYTLEELAEEKGCTYTETHKIMPSGVYKSTVTFHNVTESLVRSWSVGYEMSNSIGKTAFNTENMLPFTKKVIIPEITQELVSESCIDGENLTFSFRGENMTGAEWRFGKPDEEGIDVVYGVDEMKELFPESTFVTSFETDSETGESTATLVISNAKYEMYYYSLYAYAQSSSGMYLAGNSPLEVIQVKRYEITDCSDSCSTVTVCSPEAGEYTLYIAGYDSLGRFEKAYIVPLELKRGKAEYPTERGAFGDYDEIKIMLFDEKPAPLCEAYIAE